MKPPDVKRSVVVDGHKTSVSLEEAFWSGIKEISGARNMTMIRQASKILVKSHLGVLMWSREARQPLRK